VSALVARGLPSVVLLGSASEQSEVDALAARLDRETAAKVHNVAGRTSIAEMMALIESARLTIANDTAALHMAVGLGGRCVGLFGPTDPGRVGPVDLRAHVAWTGPLSAVNYRDRSLGGSVMRQLSVESVLSVISHVLESTMEPMA
jgi:ADP-heptose:LPS heptosyltransferase